MSLPVEFFDDFYAANGDDPWGYTSRWYEQRKQDLTLAALPRARYRRALEPACSIGVLSARLAQRCDGLVSTDPAEAALAAAAARVPANVELRRWGLGDVWTDETFDLVVLSEVGYLLDPHALAAQVPHLLAALEPGGTLLLAHWRHPVAEYPQSGDDVHASLVASPGLVRLGGWLDEDLRIDVLERSERPVLSVAARDGLA